MKRRTFVPLLIVLWALLLIGIPFGFLCREAQQQQRDYALLVAIRNKDPRKVALLLKQGANPNVHDTFTGQPSLGQLLRTRLEQLRRRKLPVQPEGPPALLLAVQSNNAETVRLLLAKGAREVDAKTDKGEALLLLAASQHNFDIVRALIEHNADVKVSEPFPDPGYRFTLLTFVAGSRQIDLAQTLLAKGLDVNGGAIQHGWPPLFFAAEADDLPMVKLLLAHGADVNIEDPDMDHSSALNVAADNGNLEMVQLLLDHKANVNSWARCGSALTHAAEKGNIPMVRLLLAHGANPNIGDDCETLPILMACDGKTEIMKLLLDAGADINAKGYHGCTALYHAVESRNVKMVRLLLAHGANVHALAPSGEPGLTLADAKGFADVVQILKQAGTKE